MLSELFSTPQKLYSLAELTELGYGANSTLRSRIKANELPAVLVGNAYKVRHSDLALLVHPMQQEQPQQEINATIAKLVAGAPRLTTDQRASLAALLGGASA